MGFGPSATVLYYFVVGWTDCFNKKYRSVERFSLTDRLTHSLESIHSVGITDVFVAFTTQTTVLVVVGKTSHEVAELSRVADVMVQRMS
jgi:hypothetical protein